MSRNRKSQGQTTPRANISNINSKNDDNEQLLDDAEISDDEEGGTRIGDIYIPPPIPPHCSTESKGARLIITQIDNNNFKSYAGKVTLGPFHHCFTAIIGPNGSGKSNVIDSMLFVFGYRANKIRCKKLSTLIHNSARYPNMPMCSVAVHFQLIEDKPDRTCEKVTGSEIVVERTAFRDNTSFYSINGRRVVFKEVSRLLKQHNVDLDHNRFLILQGEVESIAMMKPKGANENECGMLDYLEDIVGTTRYRKPLAQIHERVDQLTDERTEKHNRCKMADREMQDLLGPYNEAVQYLVQENENTRTKNLRIQKYLSEKNKKLEEYKKEHEIINEQLKEHDQAAEALCKQREEKEEMIRKELAEFEMLRKKKEDFQKQLEKAKSKHTEVQQTMEVTNNRRKKNKTQVEKHEKEMEDLHKVPDKNQKEIDECNKKIEKLNNDKNKFEEELQQNYTLVEEQTKPLIERRDTFDTELVELRTEVDISKEDLTVSESQLKILKHDETAETRKYESLKTSFEESQTSLAEKSARMEELTQLIPEFKNEINTKTAQIQQKQKEEEQMHATLIKITSEINERATTMQKQRSNNKVLDFLMRQKNEGKIPGILGRLGNLGGIDSKYDVAISTACGRLDNIIVDTVNTAQQCIEALKQHDVGRGSFIALEKVQYLEKYSAQIDTPENVPRLYDLVRVEDERVLPAFYFALRNTLVATDLEQGTRIAYGARRHRVVTLKGDLIETSGTMSGGGNKQISGKMGTSVQTKTKPTGRDSSAHTQKALDDMQAQAEDLQSKINYSQEEQGRLEREIQQLHVSRQKNESEIQRLSITIKSLEEQLPRIRRQLDAQKQRMAQTKTDGAQVELLEKEITKKQKRLKNAEEAADQVSDKISEIKTQIDAIHSDKIKSVQTKINGTNNQIKKLTANVARLNVEITTSHRNITKIEKQIENLRSEIKKAEEDLRALNAERQTYNDDSVELERRVNEAQTAIESAKTESSDIQKEVTLLKKQESDGKLKRYEIEQKLQTVAGKMSDVKSQIPHWQQQLKPLRLNEIPNSSEPLQPLKTYTEEELATHTLQDIQYKETLQEEQLKKKPNLSVIPEFNEKRAIYLERVKVFEDVTEKRNIMRNKYDEVRRRRYVEFMAGFTIITRKLKEMYQMITQGGDAELELVDSMDPFNEGVSFGVRPPKKTWKNISNLSGGEKTLSSLALVFALHYYKPSPLYFMDEIDAALDFKNISIVAHYIKERTKNAQFIIISLRSNMFELCDYIVGIYKVRDCTDSVTMRNVVAHTQPLPLTQSQANTTQTQTLQLAEKTLIETTKRTVNENNTENVENSDPSTIVILQPVEPTQEQTRNDITIMPSSEISVDETQNETSVATEACFKKPLPPTAQV